MAIESAPVVEYVIVEGYDVELKHDAGDGWIAGVVGRSYIRAIGLTRAAVIQNISHIIMQYADSFREGRS